MPSPRRKGTLAHDGHAPVIDDLHGRCKQWQDRKTMINATEGCVSHKSRQKSVDLVSKNRDEDEKSGQLSAGDTN
jgi:hypothetical protein